MYLILFVSAEICYTVFFEQLIIILLCKPLFPIRKSIFIKQNMIRFILHCNDISKIKSRCLIRRTQVARLKIQQKYTH